MGESSLPVTLNCSGGIALGAYMAGVFTELVKASLRPRPGNDNPTLAPALCIDTITGASAGAMTGLIAARCLLLDPGRALEELADDDPGGPAPGIRSDAEEPRNGFYRAWVQRADIRALTDHRSEEQALREPSRVGGVAPRPRLGLLSGAAIAAITDDVGGTWREADLPGMARALQARSLAVLMTTTNLQGVLRSEVAGRCTVSHAETRRFLFHRHMKELVAGTENGVSGEGLALLNRRWRKAKESARASGAFPLAFPPLSNSSDPHSYNLQLDATSLELYLREADAQTGTPEGSDPDRVLVRVNGEGEPQKHGSTLRLRFDYTDGGVLDGLPVLKGIGLLNQLAPDGEPMDGDPLDQDLEAFAGDWNHVPAREQRRRFVYVQPIPVTDLKGNRSVLQRFFGAVASALAGLTYPKAEHDHLRLEQIEAINRLVHARERLIKDQGLADTDPEAIRLCQVLPYREVRLDPIDPVLTFRSQAFRTLLLAVAAEEAELEARLEAELDLAPDTSAQQPDADPSPVSAEVAALARFETLIGKRTPGQPLPEGAVSPVDLLASDLLAAFGGFFHERYRRHDYLIGRLSGLAWILDVTGQPDAVLPDLRAVVGQARRDYLPQRERTRLHPLDWLRLLRLLAVRLPYVLLSDHLARRNDPPRSLPAPARTLLRQGIAPLLGILGLLLLLPAALLVGLVALGLGGLAALTAVAGRD
ncbi:conserved hypothetical protein [Cyanobium sp. PCC 7001]|uniref:DUF3376 domain-containing protein n=1 Tax=Cyanobium sp. PCC 7001 TaxID=180281 RepID=UPI0001804DE6|nr:DUF3376 domain-containing protein [Cyanobium sp. PCC 7001]EDY39510.1 conserved hypothetical protein [Cyanobium sp. PCC 7001]